ncbi:MAG: recombinase family protein [Bacteroides sp.]|nr:recombinase family protein [Eubacterium sp.]MCM1418221.1 recombinase family protein [Roseburia sp.]MCM1462772.1 recombinase family protein [Bacteroides sp.]
MTGTAIQSDMRVVMIPAKSREEIQRTTRLKVAAYCRVSTDQEEQESSYEAQISYYTDKIGNNSEWQLAGIFADEGITGTQAKKRPEFMKMIRLFRQRKIDMVLTKSLSRFARNTVECLKYIRDLKALGIAIVFEKENLNTLETDTEMMLTIMSCFAQAESESISKNVAWGIRQSFKNGNVPMQYARLLGYKKGENELPEIVPDEAEIVREIFRRYLDGASMEQIADGLNARGLTTKGSGSPYRKIAIQRILTNEKYTGDALLQKTYITDCITKKSRKNNGELPMYLVKNHHEPIISRADFNRVQEEMARRSAKRTIAEKLTKTEQGKYSAKYALSELLICGECGAHYRRVTWTAKGFKEIKWRCISRIQYGKKKCHCSPTVDEQALHKTIVSAINEFCEVKDDVAKVLRESITEVLDPNLSGSVQAAQ